MSAREPQIAVRHADIAAAAKREPGTWQRLGVYRNTDTSKSIVTQVETACLSAYGPAGSFAAYRTVSSGYREVWVCYADGAVPEPVFPEELPEPVRLLVVMGREMRRFVSGAKAADYLAAHGQVEAAELVRGYIGGRDGRTSAMQAASFLYRRLTRAGGAK